MQSYGNRRNSISIFCCLVRAAALGSRQPVQRRWLEGALLCESHCERLGVQKPEMKLKLWGE